MSRKLFPLLALLAVIMVLSVGSHMLNDNESATAPHAGKLGGRAANADSGTAQTDKAPVKLKVQAAVSTAELAELKRMAAGYERLHPGVTVSWSNLSAGSAYNAIKRQLAAGTGADVYLVDNTWVYSFAQAGYLSPAAGGYFNGSEAAVQNDTVMNQLKWNGILWGIPKDLDPYVLVWNRDLFTSRNLKAPDNSSDWLNALQAFATTSNSKDPAPLYLDPADPYAFMSLMWSLGLNVPGGKTPGNWNPADIEHALNQLEPLNGGGSSAKKKTAGRKPSRKRPAEKKAAAPDGRIIRMPALTGEQAWKRMNAGGFAMMIARASDYDAHADTGKLAANTLPVENDKGDMFGAWLEGRSYVVSIGSKHPSEAFSLIRELTGKTAQIQAANDGFGYPANLSYYSKFKLGKAGAQTDLQLIVEQGEVMNPDMKLPVKMKILGEETQKLFSSEMSVSQFAADWLARWKSGI